MKAFSKAPSMRFWGVLLAAIGSTLPNQALASQEMDSTGSVITPIPSSSARSVTGRAGGLHSGAPIPSYSRAEAKAIKRLQVALAQKDYAAASEALATAQKVSKYPDVKHMVAALQLELGRATSNLDMQSEALDFLLQSGRLLDSERPRILYAKAEVAKLRGDHSTSELAYSQLVEAYPADPNLIVRLAETKIQIGKSDEAFPLVQKAIDLARTSGQNVPQSWTEMVERLGKGAAGRSRD